MNKVDFIKTLDLKKKEELLEILLDANYDIKNIKDFTKKQLEQFIWTENFLDLTQPIAENEDEEYDKGIDPFMLAASLNIEVYELPKYAVDHNKVQEFRNYLNEQRSMLFWYAINKKNNDLMMRLFELIPWDDQDAKMAAVKFEFKSTGKSVKHDSKFDSPEVEK